jgi:hypothetical protein
LLFFLQCVLISVEGVEADPTVRPKYITRRTVALFGGCLPFCLAAAHGQAPVAAHVRFRIDSEVFHALPQGARQNLETQEDQSPEAQEMVRLSPPQRAVPIILIAVGVLSIPIIWNSIQEIYREYYYGGVIVDLRQTPPLITSSKIIPPNMTFVTDPSGKLTQYKANEFTQQLLETLLIKGK